MWIHVPTITSALLQEEADLTQGFNEQAQAFAQYCTWKTKPKPKQSWLKIFKREGCMMLLSGAILNPTIMNRYATQYLSDLQEGTHANHSATQENKTKTIPVSSGLQSPMRYGQLSLIGFSSRIQPHICGLEDTKSSRSYRKWATWLRATSSQRRRQEAHIKGKDFSSLRQGEIWNTPTSRDWKDSANPSLNAPTNSLLGRQAPRWMTSGRRSLRSDQTLRLQLNPKFSEWLMGISSTSVENRVSELLEIQWYQTLHN